MSNLWESIYHPDYITGYNPFIIKNMNRAVDRMVAAINHREKIVIYGGCDVDSLCGIASLLLILKYLNADVEYLIDDISGNNNVIDSSTIKNSIDFLGAQLLISVGVNFASNDEVELCKQLNIDSIVVENKKTVNDKEIIYINPSERDCTYRYKDLSTSGITFKLMQAIAIYYNMNRINRYLDLILLGTMCKEINTQGENRIFLKVGEKYLKATDNYGLKAIMSSYKINEINKNSIWDIIRILTPISGVVSRRDNARIVVELLTTDDKDRAKQIVKYLKKGRLVQI
ncbi:DHH family phosphoesterase [Inconstantimicrobium porci]|uniref:Phosphoesterase n=1 Tax=Inconstantimicrobium porci TaxID=2652291 RepID=A0A7X2MVL5_9CLOT|nr:DHH family phosphoesterase [Inconstantimicrobium porci]MDD6770206.1 DHH family phosphoesterase [Inconstantimicrobium porci]MSR89845.1 phosphoesterase [Inconstantimicrobium porci]